MNNFWKWILAIVVIFVIASEWYQYFDRINLRRDKEISDVKIMLSTDSVKTFKTKTGEAYAKLNSILIEKSALSESLLSMGQTNKKLNSENIKQSDIISVLKSKLLSTGHDTITLHDTTFISSKITGKDYLWTNNYLSLWGTIVGYKMNNNYSYKIDLTYITEQASKKKSIVTVSLSDPNARILTGGQIIVIQTPKWYDHWYYYALTGLVAGHYIFK